MSTRSARAVTSLALVALAFAATAGHATASCRARAGTAAAPNRESAGAAARNWRQLGRVLLPRNTVTLARAKRFTQIDIGELNARRHQLGQPALRALILDVDETMAPHHGRIGAANMAHIRSLIAQGVTIAIYSNARDDATPGRAEDFATLRSMGAYIAGEEVASKPSRLGFEAVTKGLVAHARKQGRTVSRDQIAMVGDNYMTDGGAIQAGLAFVKVKPVKTDNSRFRRPLGVFAKRTFQRASRAYATLAAGVHDLLGPDRTTLQLDR